MGYFVYTETLIALYFAVTTCWFIVCVPTFVWCCILLYKYRNKQYFVKRRPVAVAIHLCCFFVYGFSMCSWISYCIDYVASQNTKKNGTNQ